MPYGTIKIDTVTFTDAGVDKSVTLSGLVQNPTFSGSVTVTGTFSGVTVTGTTANFTSGNFTNISGGTHTITSGVFAAGSAASPSITFTGDLNTGIYSPGADQVAISTGGSGRLFVDASGRVGLGASSPQSLLHIDGDATAFRISRGSAIGFLYNTGTTATDAFRLQSNGGSVDLLSPAGQPITFSAGGSEKVRITSAGLVGVGTSSPGNLLHVTASSGDAIATIGTAFPITLWTNATTSTPAIYTKSGSDIRIGTTTDGISATGFAENFRFTSTGRLGVGTTGPLATFDVKPSSDRHVLVTSSATYASNGIVATNDAGSEIALGIGGTPIQFFTGATERARIDSSGRWLLGTSTGLGTNNSITIKGTAASNPSIYFARNANASSIVTDNVLGFFEFGSGDGGLGAEIRANADGAWSSTSDCPSRLVFSTTADGASSPTERMRISQSGTVTIYGPGGGTFLNLSNSGGYSGLHEVDNTAYTIGQNSDLRAMRIGSGANWLTTGVSLAAGGTSWSTYSDERLKTDIVELAGCLDGIKAIRCVSYRLTDVDDASSKKRIGVIAQDLVGKYDEAITTSRRSEGDETEYLSVQYSDLIPVLLKALQEASVKIETLEAKVAALESA